MSSEEDTRRLRTRIAEIQKRWTAISEPILFEADEIGWSRPGLDIKIPESVINTVVVEAVKQAVNFELKNEIKTIVSYEIISSIILPSSVVMTIFSTLTALFFIFIGAWVTSIPFITASLFMGYFNYLNRRNSN